MGCLDCGPKMLAAPIGGAIGLGWDGRADLGLGWAGRGAIGLAAPKVAIAAPAIADARALGLGLGWDNRALGLGWGGRAIGLAAPKVAIADARGLGLGWDARALGWDNRAFGLGLGGRAIGLAAAPAAIGAVGLAGGAVLSAGSAVIPAAIQSRHAVATYDVPTTGYRQPVTIDVPANVGMMNFLFRSASSKINVAAKHEGAKGSIKETVSQDEPHILKHTVTKPIMQEVKEIVSPYRKIVQGKFCFCFNNF